MTVNSTDDIVYGAIRRNSGCKECGCCTRSFSRVAGEIPATLLKLNISNIKVISENGMAFCFTWNEERRG
nr:MAG TPA: hypothetical protein [Caudoviricetes sp.]